MSLLTNPFFQVGMGLLANSGPSLTPVNPWAGVQQGLLNARNAQLDEQTLMRQQQEWTRQQEEWKRQDEQRRYIEQMASEAPTELQGLARAFPEAYATSMAKQQFSPRTSEQISTAGQLGITSLPAEMPVKVKSDGQGGVAYEPIQLQSTDNRTSDEKNYAAAQAQGYQGSFMDFKKDMAAAGATKIDMGGTDRVSPSEAGAMVYPDGSQVPPGELWEVARAKGARMLTKEEQAAMTQRGAQTEKDAAAADKGVNLFTNYIEAAKAYKSGVLPYGSADEQAKRARQALVTWYAKNVLGTPGAEPSPSLYDKAEQIIPDYGGPWDAAMFNSRMSEIQRTIDAALGSKPKQSNDMTDVTLMYNPKTKRLEPVK